MFRRSAVLCAAILSSPPVASAAPDAAAACDIERLFRVLFQFYALGAGDYYTRCGGDRLRCICVSTGALTEGKRRAIRNRGCAELPRTEDSACYCHDNNDAFLSDSVPCCDVGGVLECLAAKPIAHDTGCNDRGESVSVCMPDAQQDCMAGLPYYCAPFLQLDDHGLYTNKVCIHSDLPDKRLCGMCAPSRLVDGAPTLSDDEMACTKTVAFDFDTCEYKRDIEAPETSCNKDGCANGATCDGKGTCQCVIDQGEGGAGRRPDGDTTLS